MSERLELGEWFKRELRQRLVLCSYSLVAEEPQAPDSVVQAAEVKFGELSDASVITHRGVRALHYELDATVHWRGIITMDNEEDAARRREREREGEKQGIVLSGRADRESKLQGTITLSNINHATTLEEWRSEVCRAVDPRGDQQDRIFSYVPKLLPVVRAKLQEVIEDLLAKAGRAGDLTEKPLELTA